MHVLARDGHLLQLVVAALRQTRGHEPDELLGSRCAGGQPDRLVPVDELSGSSLSPSISCASAPAQPRHLDQPLRVRARLRADHEHERGAAPHHLLDGVLAVLGRVADVVGGGPAQAAEAAGERVDGRGDVVERERRLGHDRDRLAARVERERVLGRLDHDRGVRALAARPDHLDVVGVADERDQVAAVRVAARLRVHLRDERADGVDDAQPALLAVLLHRRRDAVRREHADLARRDLVLALDEHGAEPLEPAHDVLVVDDVVADVDRRAVLLEQPLDDLDRAVDAGAERPRRREQDAPAHATASSAFSARRAPAAARAVTTGSRAKPGAAGRPRSRSPSAFAPRAIPPSRRSGVSEIARMQPASRPVRASGARLHVDRVGAGLLAQPRALGRLVDDPRRAEDRPRPRAGDAERRRPPRAPSRARRRRASRRSRSRSAGPGAASRRSRTRRAAPPARAATSPSPTRTAGPSRRAIRSSARHRAGEGQPVSVQAMLRTDCFTLPVASNAAEGSKPEWIAQCSQRGSFPGP